ncbi:MAG: helix-turn-helix transcriptional regulator [Eubacterium sp.]|nr:helix-turn-helix transcriptional regulator [Eubacterium sp.]
MEKISRNIGMGIYSVLKQNEISVEEAADKIGYSLRDMWRIIEGRLFVSPRILEDISNKLDTSVEYLINYKPTENSLLPELEYNKVFTDRENLYKIIDLLDDYIELKEQM